MRLHIPSPRVALVYPPYGPPNLASLGLSILQAGIRARGFDCATFYWAYRWLRQLPVAPDKQRAFYYMLTQRSLSPWNEWMFTRNAFGERLQGKDAEAISLLKEIDREIAHVTHPILPSQVIISMCNNMDALLAPLLEELAAFDIIGIATTFFQNGAALALCKSIKARWPEKITMLGGANCDGEMGRGLIDNFSFIDCVFTGEVDFQVPEFIHALHQGSDVSTISGLIWRDDDGQIHANATSPPVQAMDDLPIPDFGDWAKERKRFDLYDPDHVCIPLESSRGCWWGAKSHCTFCGLNANGMAYRQKSPLRFQSEVQTIVEQYGARYLFMADNILSTEYYRTFLDWARAQNIDLEMFYEIKANVSRDQITKLADAGVRMVQPGIEHFSSKVLSLMKKGVKGIQNVAFLKYAAEKGILTVYSILAGFPGEDPYEYEHLAREIHKLVHLRPPGGVVDIEFHRFSPYHNRPEEFGIRLRPHPKYSFIFPLEEKEIRRIAYQFVMAGRRNEDLSYLSGAIRAVTKWRSGHDSTKCLLTWRWDGLDIIISDRRPGFEARDFRLRGALPGFFLEFESPSKPERAADRLRASTHLDAEAGQIYQTVPDSIPNHIPEAAPEKVLQRTREEILSDPVAALSELSEAGFFWEEDGVYINLPITAAYTPTTTTWNEVAVP